MDDIIKLNNQTIEDFKNGKIYETAKNFHILKKEVGLFIGKYYGFKTQCCSISTIQIKDKFNQFTCHKCKSKIKSTDLFLFKDYFFYYDLAQVNCFKENETDG